MIRKQQTKKKYKVWKEDESIAIPLKTIQRWKKKSAQNKEVQNSIPAYTESYCESNDLNYGSEDESSISYDDTLVSVSDSGSSANESNEKLEEELVPNIHINEVLDDKGDDDTAAEFDTIQNISENIENVQSFIYEGSNMTLEESILSIMELYMKHKWTKTNFHDTLQVIRRMLPENNRIPNTLYKLLQYLKSLAPPILIQKHYYCKKCLSYKGVLEAKNQECNSETCKLSICIDISVFYEIDIYGQIRHMFECRNLAEKLLVSNNNADIICDITDGTEYIRVNSRNGRRLYDLTLILNTDGFSLSKSSKSECWPLMFMIAELPEFLRESFLIVTGIWHDTSKPKMNTFLKPFCDKLHQCFRDGITWIHPSTKEVFVSKVTAPLIITDAPARAILQNIVNFNGRYGCNICEIKTQKSIAIDGKKRVRVYTFPVKDIALRTKERMQQQGEKAEYDDKIKHIKGVKGISVISSLPMIDLGTCVLPEYMHSVLLGVVRQILDIWITKPGAWNIKKFCKEIDSFLLNIRPPSAFSRMPRSILLYYKYKASEFYNWLLFYSIPTLENYLPAVYFQHWLLLVIAIYTLLQKTISNSELREAEILLKLFVRETGTLYGDRQFTYNVHQLLHLVLCVKRWGPLWATSAFPFENFNGILAKMVHGTKNIGQEITGIISTVLGVHTLRYRINIKNNVYNAKRNYNEVIGSIVNISLNYVEKELLTSIGINIDKVYIFSRARINGEVYTSLSYKTQTKNNSYTVQIIAEDNSVIYGIIKFFFKIDQKLYFLLQSFSVVHTKIFFHKETETKVKHILPIKKDKFLFVDVENVNCICHVIRVGDYICKRPNLLMKVM